MNRTGKSLNKQCFCFEVSKVTVFQHWRNHTIIFPLVYCPVDDNVVRSRPRNSLFRYVKSLLLLWKPHSLF